MKKLNQRGMTGPVEIGLIVVFVVFVGFVAYRIGSARNDDGRANQSAEDADNEAAEIKVNENEADEAKEVDVPSEEEKKDEVKEDPATEPVKVDKPVVEDQEEPKKKEYTYVGFTSEVSKDGDTISASATLAEAYTGNCYLKMYRDGEPKVTRTVKLTDGQKTCSATYNTSELSVSGKWELHAWFESAGGTVKGNADVKFIEVELSE